MANNNKNKNQNKPPVEEVDSRATVVVEFDGGDTTECFVEGVFGVGGTDYIALEPNDDSGDIYIYKYIEDKKKITYTIEEETDDAKFEAAVRAYEKIVGYKGKGKK